jgi:hypothetical protein
VRTWSSRHIFSLPGLAECTARWRAGLERPGVLALGERGVDLGRHSAGPAGDVIPAVAEGRSAGRGGIVVAGLVEVATLFWMVSLAVELDDQAVLLVVAVAAAAAAVGLGEPRLLAGQGEPVRLLHVAVVAVLQY